MATFHPVCQLCTANFHYSSSVSNCFVKFLKCLTRYLDLMCFWGGSHFSSVACMICKQVHQCLDEPELPLCDITKPCVPDKDCFVYWNTPVVFTQTMVDYISTNPQMRCFNWPDLLTTSVDKHLCTGQVRGMSVSCIVLSMHCFGIMSEELRY